MRTVNNPTEEKHNMLDLDTIRALLADRRLDIVSAATGLSRGTVAAVRDGVNTNPTLETLRKLSDYLKAPV